MAVFHGKIGEVRWDTDTGGTEVEVEHITNWTASVTADVVEATAMEDTYKSHTVGFLDWTATATGYIDTTGLDVPLAGGGGVAESIGENTPARLELFFDNVGGDTNEALLYGYAICTDISMNVDADGNPTVTYSWQGQSQLVYATTDPAGT